MTIGVRANRRLATGLATLTLAPLLGALTAHAGEGDADDKDGDGPNSETVVVTGRRAALDVLPAKILDAPQSINVIPKEIIKEQGIATLQEALRNVPGITLNAGEGGTHGDLVNLRGFSAGDDFFMDGLRDTGLYNRDAFDYDAVEVYKGPASTLFGRGSTGGVVNQVIKTPLLTPLTNVTLVAGTNSEARATADLNYVLDDHIAFRINLMGQRNGYEGRPFVRSQRFGVAPAIGFGIGTSTSFTLKYLHQQQDDFPDYGIPFLFDRPAPVGRGTFYGLAKDDRFQAEDDIVTGRFDHSFSDNWSVSDTARYGHYWFLSRQTAAIYGTANCFPSAATDGYFTGAPICSGAAGQVAVAGDNPYFPVLGTPIDAVNVLRDRPSSRGTITTLMNNLAVTGKFATGPLNHTLVFGAEYDHEEADLTRYANQDGDIVPVPLLAPDAFEDFPGSQTTVTQRPDTKTRTFGLYATDTIALGEQWLLTGAIRYDNFRATFDQPLGKAAHFKHTDEIWSPRAALVYKPAENVSFYFSYGTSFNPSAENLALSASNQALPPEKDRTFEVGGKAQVLDGALSITAAAFNTKMTNARITDPLQPALQTLAGTERVNGFEIGLQGHLTRNIEVIAGYTYLDGKAVGLAGPGVEGPIPNTAHNQANLWTVYEFDGNLDGLKVGAGINYIGQRLAGTDALLIPGQITVATVPGFTTFDGLISYRINDAVTLQLNGYNLFDKFYYANSYFTRPYENHTVPGAGRTVLLTASLSL